MRRTDALPSVSETSARWLWKTKDFLLINVFRSLPFFFSFPNGKTELTKKNGFGGENPDYYFSLKQSVKQTGMIPQIVQLVKESVLLLLLYCVIADFKVNSANNFATTPNTLTKQKKCSNMLIRLIC